MSTKKRIIKDIFFYSLSTITSQVILVIKNCLIANILAPANFGFWKFLQLLLDYGMLSPLGITEGLRQTIPVCTTKGEQENIYHIRNVAFTSSVLSSAIYCMISFIVYLFIFNNTFIRSKGFPDTLSYYLISINILIIITIVYTFLWRYLSTINRFSEVSRIKLIVSVLDFGFSVYLAYKFKVAGLIAGLLITYIVAISIISRKGEFRPHFAYDIKETLNLLYLGLPLFGMGLVFQLLTSIDRIIIVKFLDNTQLGLYGIVLIASNMFSLLSLPSSHVIYPRMIEEFSRSGFTVSETFKKYVLMPTEVLSYIIPPAVAFVYFFMPLIVIKFFPEYILAIKAILLLVTGVSLLNLMSIFSFAVVIMRKYKLYISFFLIGIIINSFLTFILVKIGYGIEGIAFSSAISYSILTSMIIYYILSLFGYNFIFKITLIIKMYLPLVFTIVICALIYKMLNRMIYEHNLLFSIISSILYFAVYALFLFYYVRDSRVISDLRGILKEAVLKY